MNSMELVEKLVDIYEQLNELGHAWGNNNMFNNILPKLEKTINGLISEVQDEQ